MPHEHDDAPCATASEREPQATMSRRVSPTTRSECPDAVPITRAQTTTAPPCTARRAAQGTAQPQPQRAHGKKRKQANSPAAVAFAAAQVAERSRRLDADKTGTIRSADTGPTATSHLCWGYGTFTPDHPLLGASAGALVVIDGVFVHVLLVAYRVLSTAAFASVAAVWALFAVGSLAALLRTAFMDPGVLPRGNNAGTIRLLPPTSTKQSLDVTTRVRCLRHIRQPEKRGAHGREADHA